MDQYKTLYNHNFISKIKGQHNKHNLSYEAIIQKQHPINNKKSSKQIQEKEKVRNYDSVFINQYSQNLRKTIYQQTKQKQLDKKMKKNQFFDSKANYSYQVSQTKNRCTITLQKQCKTKLNNQCQAVRIRFNPSKNCSKSLSVKKLPLLQKFKMQKFLLKKQSRNPSPQKLKNIYNPQNFQQSYIQPWDTLQNDI